MPWTHPVHQGLSRCFAIVLLTLLTAFSLFASASAEDFDWRDINGQNWVTPVKNQGPWGTCWAFGGSGVIEAKYMLTRNDNTYQPNVSEQQLVWETNPNMGSAASGGRVWEVLDYFTDHGVVLETECPYQMAEPGPDVVNGDYWPLDTGWASRVFKSTSNLTRIAEGRNTAYIKDCLKKYGPLSLRMDVYSEFYIPSPGAGQDGHVVVIVGFHDNLPGESAPGGGYWIIKNSWGTGFNPSGPGTIQDGYGAVAYATRPSYDEPTIWNLYTKNYDIGGINGLVYYTGAMATVTWNGGSGAWTSGGNTWSGTDQYGTALPTYAWQNRETTAIFGASADTTVSLSGTVIAHGLTINSGATGYVFNGVSNGALTVTAGGITANENVTINAPVTIGAPQTWTVATGKSLTIGGNVHTIISGLTISGNASTVITGSIDGGGVLNTMGVAPGKITLVNNAYLILNGAATYSVPIDAQSSSHGILFAQPTGVAGNCYGVISGGGWIDKTDRGTIVLHADNTYTNWTSIYDGAVQADSGTGLPSASLLNLNGGVLQSNGTTTFIRVLGTSGTNKFQWNTGGGGFAGGAGPMTVRIGNDAAIMIAWGSTVGTNLVGTLKFGSTTAANSVTFENLLDLTAAERTIYVDDNPNTDDDVAIISGKITDSSGNWTGGIRKTGAGTLILTGDNENGVGDGSAGNTTIAEGVLQADRNQGLSNWAGLILDGGVLQSDSAITYAEPLWDNGSGSNRVKWKSGGFSAGGGKMTVNIGGDATPQTVNFGGSDGTSAIAGVLKLSSNTAHYETELRNSLNLNNGARTIQVDENPDDTGDFATISGVISGTGSWTKTGSGSLTLSGSSANTYTGAATVNAGRLRLNKTSGVAITGDFSLVGNGLENNYVYLDRSNQIAASAVVTFVNDPSHSSRFNLLGHAQTLAGIVCSDGRGVIQNVENESGVSANGVLTLNSADSYSYNGYLRDRYQDNSTGKVAVVKTGAGTQTLSGENIKYTGGTTVSGGTLLLADTTNADFLASGVTVNAGGTLEFSTAATDVNVNYTGVLAGSGTVNKSGSYALTLGGASGNTFTGTTNVTAGKVYLNKSAGVAIGGNLNINAVSSTYVYLDADEQIANSAVVTFANTSSYYSYLYLQGHTETVAGISDTAGRGIIQSGNLIVNNAANCTYAGYLRNYGSYPATTLVKQGAGTLTLSGNKIQYTGGTTVSGGKLVLQNATYSTFLASNITNNATVEFDVSSTNINFTGTISGTGAVRKTGSYKLTLGSASNSYSGGTTVVDGILAASSTAAPGTITIQSGGAFAPGNVDVIGSVTTGAATCSGGEYLFEINDANGSAGTSWDLWNVNGNLSITPGATLSVSTLAGTTGGPMADFDNENNYSWLVAQTTGLIYGFGYLELDASNFLNALDPAGYLRLSQSANYKQLFLTYALSVPGDTNHDNYVNETDAAALAAHWGQAGTWTDGDFNDDGWINARDASILAANWGYVGESYNSESLPLPVPEPSTLVLLAAGLLSLLRRTKRETV
ncbi:MAG TPA: autotransporter-associated beta strand repeat-containing protein [Thermoguttaceae bacterium]|nr:autotransporter-associated beta strand repeat-containing protein [Thermoguttaceae bacterium]